MKTSQLNNFLIFTLWMKFCTSDSQGVFQDCSFHKMSFLHYFHLVSFTLYSAHWWWCWQETGLFSTRNWDWIYPTHWKVAGEWWWCEIHMVDNPGAGQAGGHSGHTQWLHAQSTSHTMWRWLLVIYKHNRLINILQFKVLITYNKSTYKTHTVWQSTFIAHHST